MREAYEAERPASDCKGCSADVNIPPQQIERMVAALESKGFDCASEEEYQMRLRMCRECPSLMYATTCTHCGCIVQVRAKLADKHCPFPGSPKW